EPAPLPALSPSRRVALTPWPPRPCVSSRHPLAPSTTRRSSTAQLALGSVHTLTGNYSYAQVDAQIAGRGPSPAFARGYNSDDTRVGPLGPGWTHGYNIRLRSPGDGTGDLILVGPQGRSDRYTYVPATGAF